LLLFHTCCFEILEKSPGKQAVGSPLWSFSFSVIAAFAIHSVAHHRTGGDGAFLEGQAGPLSMNPIVSVFP
jgi:hypothetical protein